MTRGSESVEHNRRPSTRTSVTKKKGIVVSNKGSKTCIVAVKRRTFHKRYGKVLSKTKRYSVHDETQTSKVGDIVEFYPTRPISKRKRWILK